MARRRDVDHLPAERMDQRIIFTLRVADDHVILRDEEDIADLTLGGEGFTGTRRTQDQAVGVLQFLPVHHDHVVGEGIESVIEGLAFHEQFLCRKWHKDRSGSRGQRPLDRHLVEAERHAAHQSRLLLVIEPAEHTVVFLRNTGGLKDHVVQLLPAFRRVQEQDCDQEHSLVSRLQVFQQSLGLVAVGHQIRRDDIHIVPGPHCLFLFLDLHPVDVRHLTLYQFDRLHLVDGLDVQVDDQVLIHVQELGQHFVCQFRRQDLQVAHRPQRFTHPEVPSLFELKARRSHKILRGQAGF